MNGTPCSGPRQTCGRPSRSRASATARSPSQATIALMRGFSASSCSSAARQASSAEISLLTVRRWESCTTAAGPYTHAVPPPPSFRDDSQLDPSQVRDERGRGGFGGGRIAVGGGGLGVGAIVVILLLQLLGGGGSLGQLGGLQDQTSAGAPPGDLSDCRTGADANARQDCRIIGYVNSVQRFWKDEFARRSATYQPATTYFETGQWQTGCGPASTDVGPFYCPADKHVYIDLTFLDELHDRFGATGGSLAQGYVIAHEYGHHVQDLLGTLAGRRNGAGRRARPCARSCRPTASPGCGPRTRPRRAC